MAISRVEESRVNHRVGHGLDADILCPVDAENRNSVESVAADNFGCRDRHGVAVGVDEVYARVAGQYRVDHSGGCVRIPPRICCGDDSLSGVFGNHLGESPVAPSRGCQGSVPHDFENLGLAGQEAYCIFPGLFSYLGVVDLDMGRVAVAIDPSVEGHHRYSSVKRLFDGRSDLVGIYRVDNQ